MAFHLVLASDSRSALDWRLGLGLEFDSESVLHLGSDSESRLELALELPSRSGLEWSR